MIFKAKKNYKKCWMCPRCGFTSGKRDMNKHFNSDPPCEAIYLDVTYEEIAKDYDLYYNQLQECIAEANSVAQEPSEDSEEQEPEEPYVDPLLNYYTRIPRSMIKAMTMDSMRGIDKARLMNETARIMEREVIDPDDRDMVTMSLSLFRVILLESLPNVCKLFVDPEGDWNWLIVPFLRGSEGSYIPFLRVLAILDSVTKTLADTQDRADFLEKVITLHFFRFGGLPGAPGAGDNPGANNSNNGTTTISQRNRNRNGVPLGPTETTIHNN